MRIKATAVNDVQHANLLVLDFVHDAKIEHEPFPDFRLIELRNDTSDQRIFRQRACRCENPVDDACNVKRRVALDVFCDGLEVVGSLGSSG